MITLDQILTAAADAEAKAERSQLTANAHLYRGLGEDALGVDGEQWDFLTGHIATALGADVAYLAVPAPTGLIAAAVLLDVEHGQIRDLAWEADPRKRQEATHEAYERAEHLARSLRVMLHVVTTIRPRRAREVSPVDLVTAADRYRRASDEADEAREVLYESVRAAKASGTPQAEISRITGLSKPMVYKIVS